MQNDYSLSPTGTFIGASWAALLVGGCSLFDKSLERADTSQGKRGPYFTSLMYAFFSAVFLQKSVRDRLKGIKVTGEKGFYVMSFVLGPSA